MLLSSQSQSSQSNTGRFLRLPEVLKIYPVGRTSWWGGIKAGKYPRPVHLTPRTVAWYSGDIEALVQRTREGVKA